MLTLNPFKAVSFNQTAIEKALKVNGHLVACTKYDGIRALFIVKPTSDINGRKAATLNILSRTDKAIPSLTSFMQSVDDKIRLGRLLSESIYPNGLIIDGELLVKNVDFQTGSGILRRKAQLPVSSASFIMFDFLPLNVISESKQTEVEIPYCVRSEQLRWFRQSLSKHIPELDTMLEDNHEVFSMDDINDLYNGVRKVGHEGLIIKEPMGFYKRGKKTGWWKMKPEENIDGTVIGVNWGTKGLANEGKVIGFQVLLENGVVVDANSLTQAQMEEYTTVVLQSGQDDIYNGRQVEVKFMEKTPSGSLRHPSFYCWRDLEGAEGIKS